MGLQVAHASMLPALAPRAWRGRCRRTTSAALSASRRIDSMRLAVLAAATALLMPGALHARPDDSAGPGRPAPSSAAARTRGALRIDGRLEEPDWARATPTDSFTETDPNEGETATELTELRVL